MKNYLLFCTYNFYIKYIIKSSIFYNMYKNIDKKYKDYVNSCNKKSRDYKFSALYENIDLYIY